MNVVHKGIWWVDAWLTMRDQPLTAPHLPRRQLLLDYLPLHSKISWLISFSSLTYLENVVFNIVVVVTTRKASSSRGCTKSH